MVKEGYKEVRVGPQKEIIPENWEVKALSDIGKFINGKGFSSSDWEKQGLPIVRIQNLNDEEAEYNYYSGDVKDRYYLENGDILLSWSASLGAYKWNRGNAILNQHIFKVLPKDNINKEFMYQLLLVTIDKLEQKTHGSTMKHIRRKELDLTYFPLPPLFEQKKIASILSSVDNTIEKTDEVIEEIKELKKGLMQELLTKGIGHSEFKEVRIGPRDVNIPIDWEVKKINDIAKVKGGKRVPKNLSLVEDETPYPYIRVSDFDNLSVDTDDLKYATEEIFNKISRYTISKDDVYISIAGTIGLVGVVPDELDNQLLTENAAKIMIKEKGEVDNKFLAFSLSGFEPQSQIQAFIGTTGVPKLSLGRTKKIMIPLPPLEEQKKIASILSSVDSKIKKEEEYKTKMERLKKGLMQKLLTGEIRVNIEMEV